MSKLLISNLGKTFQIYMYLSPDAKPTYKILRVEDGDPRVVILCITEHVSFYRNKIINKIKNKYLQDDECSNQILILDFRSISYDSSTLASEISIIFEQIGKEYHHLIGLIIAIPKDLLSSVFDEVSYFFIANPYAIPPDTETIKKIAKLPKVQKSEYKITQTRIIVRPLYYRDIKLPCEPPNVNDIRKARLPL